VSEERWRERGRERVYHAGEIQAMSRNFVKRVRGEERRRMRREGGLGWKMARKVEGGTGRGDGDGRGAEKVSIESVSLSCSKETRSYSKQTMGGRVHAIAGGRPRERWHKICMSP
jgi:hypothetical protein